jgi:ferrous iron transport protein B
MREGSGPREHDPVVQSRERLIALLGNPNSGKTTVFNALTGLRQKVANYPGVTVEKKEGRLRLPDGGRAVLLDLPGTYSLSASSPDERIATDILLGRSDASPRPDLVVCVVDASNLERNLYLVSQVIDTGLACVVALNMVDVAEAARISIDVPALARELGVTVIPTVASRGTGIPQLLSAIEQTVHPPVMQRRWRLPEPVEEECRELTGILEEAHSLARPIAFHEALTLLSSSTASLDGTGRFAPAVLNHVRKDHQKLDFLGFDRPAVIVDARYRWIKQICRTTSTSASDSRPSVSDRIDRVVTHRFWGVVIFLGLMALMFQMIFSWAALPTAWIGSGFDHLGAAITAILPPGDLRDLIVRGGLGGVAAVVTFLPQILFLFLFLGILEDTGYMARAAFIMDRLMSSVGLHGKSFIPLLSSFACAVPGIMATRTIENRRDRIATIMVAPLMSCSARLPVYTLLIAAFIPAGQILGVFSLSGLTLFALYVLGFVAAAGMAWVFKKTLLRSPAQEFIMELPPYRLPSVRSIGLQLYEKALSFLKRAGTIILGVSIVLWFLASYPKLDRATPSEQLAQSFAGQAGRTIEPLIAPLGFDWKIGIGLVSSLLQREVFVSTMGTLYNVEGARDGSGSLSLQERLRNERDPVTGARTFTLLTALSLMVYYVLAMQCISTVVIVYRETGGWKWPLLQIGYMTALAYGATFLVHVIGGALGIGG